MVSSTQNKHSRGGRCDNGWHLDRGREKAATLQSHFVEKGEGNHNMAKYAIICQEERGILSLVRR
jgi:hypothetical protein